MQDENKKTARLVFRNQDNNCLL